MEKAVKRYAPIFVLPTFLAFVIGFILPFIEGLYLSFCQFTTVKDAKFIGIGNYQRIFTDSTFTNSFKFTVLFAVASIVLINVIAFILALLLTRKLKGTNIFRTIFFMPNLIGGIVLGYIWQILINCVLSIVGKPLLALNTSAGYWGLIILMCWQQIGYMMIIYIAGLQSIDTDVYEAADLDGATGFKRFSKITFPLLAPSFTINMVLSAKGYLIVYDQIMAMTEGGPGTSTTSIAVLIYKKGFGGGQFAYQSANAVMLFIVVVLISVFQLRILEKREEKLG